MEKRKLFCEYGPLFYRISLHKEYLVRDFRDMVSHERFCRRQNGDFPQIVRGHRSLMLRRLEGVDMCLQHGKINNLRLAAAKVDGLVVRPGETFSFWRAIGPATAKNGYQPGLVIAFGKPSEDIGGGICQLANLIHWMVLHSPLDVTELHHHTDSIFPDSGRRVPFGTGTSVFYKNVDYRFCNNTHQAVQLRVWLDGPDLCGELRAAERYPFRYRIEEYGHHYTLEADGYYRNSRIFKRTLGRENGETVALQLVLDNHSKVLFDASLIPPDAIWQKENGPYLWEQVC